MMDPVLKEDQKAEDQDLLRRYRESAKAIAMDGYCIGTDKHLAIRHEDCPAHNDNGTDCDNHFHNYGEPDGEFAGWFKQRLKDHEGD